MLLEIGSGGAAHRFDPVKGHVIADVDYSPNARLAAAVGWSGTVEIWDLIARQHEFSLDGLRGPAHGVAFLPDDDYVDSVGEDGTARIWELQSEKQVARLVGPTGPYGRRER